MRQANTAIQHERHLTPSMDDVIHELNGATVFSKLDLKAGYHQLELHLTAGTWQHSASIKVWGGTTVWTFSYHQQQRYFKMPSALQGIEGVKNLSNDIIVHGKTQASQDHDKNLATAFQRLREKGLTLNKDKCEFNKSRLEFFWFIFQAGGISADPKKVAAIKEAPPRWEAC